VSLDWHRTISNCTESRIISIGRIVIANLHLLILIHDVGSAKRALVSVVSLWISSTMVDGYPRVPWIDMAIERYVFGSERLAWIMDEIILITIPLLGGAIRG